MKGQTKMEKKSLCTKCKNRFFIKFIIKKPEHLLVHKQYIGSLGEHNECIYRPDLRYDKPQQISMDITDQFVTECTFFSKNKSNCRNILKYKETDLGKINLKTIKENKKIPEFSQTTNNIRSHQRGVRHISHGRHFMK